MIGVWEAYCQSSRTIGLAELKSRLPAAAIIAHVEGDSLIAKPTDAPACEIEVTLERGPDVAEEASDLAESDFELDRGVPAPNLELLCVCDARYVLEYDAEEHGEVANALMTIAPVLESTCGAIIYDRTARRFA